MTPESEAPSALPEQLKDFLDRFDALVKTGAWREGPLSDRLFKRSGRVRDLRAGADIGVRTLMRADVELAALESEAALGGKGEAA